MPRNSRLDDILDAWQVAHADGRDLPAEQLCADCPDLLLEVERRLAILRRAAVMVRRPALSDDATGSATPSTDGLRTALIQPSDDPDMPDHLGAFRILSQLGRGGMGAVYRAEDPVLKRQVAIKVMLPRFAASRDARTRFLREAQAQARVDHDHVTPIYHVDEAHQPPFIVMPLLKGMTLAAALKANPRPPLATVVRIGREIAEGLAAAHQTGLIHRDIKPGNIWLEGSKLKVKILDFGLARAVAETDPASSDDEPVTAEGAVVGTPLYMSPEQAQGESVDPRTDLFSLGVVLYQMATGQLPFAGSSTAAILLAIVSRHPTGLAEISPPLPPALNGLITRLLAKDPAVRPATAEDVAEELREIEFGLAAEVPVQVIPLDSIPGVPTAPDPFADLDTTEPGTVVEPASRPHRVVGTRSRRGLYLLAAVGLAVLLGGGLLAAKLFKSAAPRGVLVVESDDPDLDVVVKQNGVVVRDRTRSREFVLPPGEYVVESADRRDGLKVKPDRVTLAKDGRETVGIWVEKPKPPKPTPPPDPVRKAAEMLNPFAELRLETASGRVITVKIGESFPKETFAINYIIIPLLGGNYPEKFADNILLPAIANLQSLGHFLSYDVQLTEKQMLQFAEMPIAKTISEIQADFELTPRLLESLKRLPNLYHLGCRANNADDTMLRQLSEFSRLTSLNFSGLGGSGKVSTEGLRTIARLKLWSFSLAGDSPAISYRECLQIICTIPTLRHAYIDCPIGDENCPILAQCQNLRLITLGGATKVTDAGLAHIGRMTSLGTLGLNNNAQITDAGLEHLREMSGLRTLELIRTKVTEAGVKRLAAALPLCKIEWDGPTIEPRDSDRAAAEWLLSRGGQFGISDATRYREISGEKGDKLPAGMFKLNNFKLTGPQFTTDADLARFRGLQNLSTLVIAETTVSDAGLEHVAAVPHLTHVYMDGMKITDTGLQHLGGCKELTTIHFNKTAVTDAGLAHLTGLNKLTELRVTGTKVTEAGVKQLAAKLPRCKIVWDGGTIGPMEK